MELNKKYCSSCFRKIENCRCRQYSNILQFVPNSSNTITNKELQDKLKEFPDDVIVVVEYCNIKSINYNSNSNLITID